MKKHTLTLFLVSILSFETFPAHNTNTHQDFLYDKITKTETTHAIIYKAHKTREFHYIDTAKKNKTEDVYQQKTIIRVTKFKQNPVKFLAEKSDIRLTNTSTSCKEKFTAIPNARAVYINLKNYYKRIHTIK